MARPAVRYRVSIPQPATHVIHVGMEIGNPRQPTEILLPVWTPGSYMVREFARHVQDFEARDAEGRALPWRKTSKDCWVVESGQRSPLCVEFEVYAHDLTVRTSHVDSTHAFFNPANLLPYLPPRVRDPAQITVEGPAGWNVATALDPGGARTFVAEDYDELVDSPFHLGPDPVVTFEAQGLPHRLALWGRGNLDTARLTADLARIVDAHADLFGGLPYPQYLFILLLTDGPRGGLEHRSSSAIMLPRFAFRAGKSYEGALKLFAHEFFHTWNVKRIRGEVLGPFDYRTENYTRLLWAMEGMTEYYCTLLLRRAGLLTPERYLEIVGEQMTQLAETPGRRLQSLEEASFDAWIKYYRPDEHTANSSVSYYLKGALANLLLDLEIRRRTGGNRSLDDLVRLLWRRYGLAGRGVPEDGYQPLVEEVAGGDWTDCFEQAIRGRGELPLEAALAAAGVDATWRADPAAPAAWLGITLRNEAGHTKVATIASDGPAWGSGLSPGDELLALDGFRVDDSTLNDRLRDYQPGDAVTLSFFRRDELVHTPVTLGARPPTRAVLARVRRPSVRQRTIYERWLCAPW